MKSAEEMLMEEMHKDEQVIIGDFQFARCSKCSGKGSQELCDLCQANYKTIADLKKMLHRVRTNATTVRHLYLSFKTIWRFNQVLWVVCASIGAITMFFLGMALNDSLLHSREHTGGVTIQSGSGGSQSLKTNGHTDTSASEEK